jgi:hypothetical protein
MKIAILTPTRQRPKELYRFFDSVNKTMSNTNEILFFIGIDHDDPGIQDYYDVIRQMWKEHQSNMVVTVIEDDRKPISKIWNELSRLRTWKNSADYSIMGNDDLVYKTRNWDMILDREVSDMDHPFYLYWFDDKYNGENHCAFPIVSKHWIATMGYFVPECFKYFYNDTWLYDIAKKTGVLHYIQDVIAEHLHFAINTSVPFDETYKFNRQGTIHEDDAKIFNDTDGNRTQIAELLKTRIDIWKTDKMKKEN